MVYSWDDKESTCYRLYIEEKKSLEDIMEHFRAANFTPSKRAFQTQFKRWDFPSKQHPAHKNAALVQRVKELWDCNTSQREMLRTLNDEGFEIKERELMRVRAKNRWLLRVPNGMKAKKGASSDQDIVNQLQAALFSDAQLVDAEVDDEQMEDMATQTQLTERANREPSPPLSPEVMQKRQERLAKLQAESAERWATRKRRRRTRGWAGLPADPPGPPRFPSETTIDESKSFLSLDNSLYRDVRSRFQRICEEADIIKKTIAGPERWEAAKDRLIQESPHLQQVFWTNEENIDAKKLALDVVCSDVTKRMRTLERRMTIAEAKNSLGVNPEQSRQLRNAFYQTLKTDHFTSKLEAGEEHWKELKASWIDGSELLQSILAPGDADPKHHEKVKAMEVLCRDVMKRLRDDQTKRDPTRKKKSDSAPIAEEGVDGYTEQNMTSIQQHLPRSTAHMTDAQKMSFDNPISFEAPSDENVYSQTAHQNLVQTATRAQAQASKQSQTQSRAQARQVGQQQQQQSQTQIMLDQIDPTLLLAGVAAANNPSLANRNMQPFSNQAFGQGFTNQSGQASFSSSQSSMPVYFRLHPASQVHSNTRLWVSMVNPNSAEQLREAAAEKFPGYYAIRVEGVLTQPNGNEMTLAVDSDEELQAYLANINPVKPIFSVQLVSVSGGY